MAIEWAKNNSENFVDKLSCSIALAGTNEKGTKSRSAYSCGFTLLQQYYDVLVTGQLFLELSRRARCLHTDFI